MSAFKDAGIDPLNDLDRLRQVARRGAQDLQARQGVLGLGHDRQPLGRRRHRRSRNAIFMWGGQLTDETGQLVVLNKEPYRANAIAGPELPQGDLHRPEVRVDAAAGRRLAGPTRATTRRGWPARSASPTTPAPCSPRPSSTRTRSPTTRTSSCRPRASGPAARGAHGAPATRWLLHHEGRQEPRGGRAADPLPDARRPSTSRCSRSAPATCTRPASGAGTEPEITESDYAKHVTDVWKKILERSERLPRAAPIPARPRRRSARWTPPTS